MAGERARERTRQRETSAGMSRRVDLDLSKKDKPSKSKKKASTGLNPAPPKKHSQATLQSFLLRPSTTTTLTSTSNALRVTPSPVTPSIPQHSPPVPISNPGRATSQSSSTANDRQVTCVPRYRTSAISLDST